MERIRKFVRHNFPFKLGALLLAIIIWNMINSAIVSSRQASLPMARKVVTQVPVKVLDLASIKGVVTIKPTVALVTVKGPPDQVQNLTAAQIMLYVDVSNLERGQRYRQQIQYSVNAWSVQVESISPREVEVELGP